MRIAVVGAGAMGGSYGGLLAVAGHEVSLIEAWREHVETIARQGLTGIGCGCRPRPSPRLAPPPRS
jgi:ketopantoate reductase